ncbi:MAG: DNA polymerase III subunit delta' [Desulfobacteraceae bacterium]|nr:DNA polymerase III subunit delta' [Desulfobacteraceae bacterium]
MRSEKLPHAFLFTGEDGVGKATAALELARICNCHETGFRRHTKIPGNEKPVFSACGKCRSCIKTERGVHPDIHRVSPEGGYIRIDRIRSLYDRLALKSDAASIRTVLIENAQLLNKEAGNALLKILEEPPESTIFVLTAPDAGDLLPTIVSRCRQIHFNPIPQKEMTDYLVSNMDLSRDNAMIVALVARGSLARAIDMAEADWLNYRNFIIDMLVRLPDLPASFRHVFAEIIASDRDKLEGVFEIMKNWYRDLAVFLRSPDKIYNHDLTDRVKAAARQIPADLIIEKADAVVKAENAISGNANHRLCLDALMAKLAQH